MSRNSKELRRPDIVTATSVSRNAKFQETLKLRARRRYSLTAMSTLAPSRLDTITIDAETNRIDVHVSAEELARRKSTYSESIGWHAAVIVRDVHGEDAVWVSYSTRTRRAMSTSSQ